MFVIFDCFHNDKSGTSIIALECLTQLSYTTVSSFTFTSTLRITFVKIKFITFQEKQLQTDLTGVYSYIDKHCF